MAASEEPAPTAARAHAPVRIERAAIGASLGGVAMIVFGVLGVRRDGWLEPRLLPLAWNALQRHCEDGRTLLVIAAFVALALLLEVVARRARGRRSVDWIATGVLAAALFVGATGHLIGPTAATPAWRGLSGIGGNVALGVVALLIVVGANAIARRVRGRPLAARIALLFALAIGATPPLLGWLGRRAEAAATPWDPARRSVILVSLDTLRADRLGCQGYGRDTTTSLDAFARDAVRFESTSTPFPFTLTAHASMLTGLHPLAHGAIPTGPKIHERLPLYSGVPAVAQAFRDAGWVTVGVVDDCLWLHPMFGLARGFDVWRIVSGDAREKTRVVDDLVRDLRGRPCLLFLHCFDIHSDYKRLPYDCAPEDRGVYSRWYHGPFDGRDPADPKVHASDLLRQWNNAGSAVDPEVVRYISDLYDEGVRSADRVVGAALARLDRAGFRDHAAIVITADHGEEFREHGRFMHDAQIFDESVRVPLLIRLPGAASAGTVVTTPVSLVDLAPTLAALAGIRFDDGAGMQGRSLLDLVGADAGEPRPVFFGVKAGEDGVRMGRFKLVRTADQIALFDLATDPGEKTSLAAERPEVVRSLLELLEVREQEDQAAAAQRSRGGALDISEEDRRRMGALGYR